MIRDHMIVTRDTFSTVGNSVSSLLVVQKTVTLNTAPASRNLVSFLTTAFPLVSYICAAFCLALGSIIAYAMLGTRTKQVSAYGRRGHRIVNASDDRRHYVSSETRDVISVTSSDDIPPTKHVVLSPSPSPQTHYVQKKKSPTFKKAKRAAKTARQEDDDEVSATRNNHHDGQKSNLKASRKTDTHAERRPLSVLPSNPSVPPALPAKKIKSAVSKPLPLKPSSPVVQLDIVTFDKAGRRVSQEKRVSRSDVQINPLQSTSKPIRSGQGASSSKIIILSSDSEEELPIVRRPRGRTNTQPKPIVISSDDSDFEPENQEGSFTSSDSSPPPIRAPLFSRRNVVTSPPTSAESSPMGVASVPLPEPVRNLPIPHAIRVPLEPPIKSRYPAIDTYHLDPGPSRSKPRQLTPIRNRKRTAAFPAPPSPPSPTTPTDFDLSLSLDFASLALSPSSRPHLQAYDKPPSAFLLPLLRECSQTTPHEFSAFIGMFPFDPITRTAHPPEDEAEPVGLAHFQKIGEASFSEVFGIGDVVLKVIPLRDENAPPVEDSADLPAPSDSKDVLNEIVVTRAMGETCGGFVKLLRTYVVRGKYPSLLLDLWDKYHERKGSESVRPGSSHVLLSGAISHIQIVHRRLSCVTGVCYHCASQRWPGFGGVQLCLFTSNPMEKSVQHILASDPCARGGGRSCPV